MFCLLETDRYRSPYQPVLSPSIRLCFPGIVLARFNSFASFLYKISLMRELFPEPETPVTQVITPNGIFTSIFFRLFSCAPTIFRNPEGFSLFSGTGILIFPLKYAPVIEFLIVHNLLAPFPLQQPHPPCSPAPGPISTMQSAASIVSSSCSTTIKVFPKSRRCFKVASSLSLSLWCNPILGSSRIYATPTKTGPYLCRQTDSLRFSAGQCTCCSGKSQIFQPYIQQELCSGIDFF